MPKQKLAFERGGTKQIELNWQLPWRNMTVSAGARALGQFADRAELTAGKDFPLEGGSVLRVRLRRELGLPVLDVLRDGKPLPGSASDPQQRLNVAVFMIFLLGGLTLVMSLVALATGASALVKLGLGWYSLPMGVLFPALGLIARKRHAWALFAALALFLGDGVANLYVAEMQGGRPPIGAVLLRLFFIIPILTGVRGVNTLNQEND